MSNLEKNKYKLSFLGLLWDAESVSLNFVAVGTLKIMLWTFDDYSGSKYLKYDAFRMGEMVGYRHKLTWRRHVKQNLAELQNGKCGKTWRTGQINDDASSLYSLIL